MAVNFSDSLIDGEQYRLKHDVATENVFRRTIDRATAQGMKVNINKTAMITVSDSISFKPEAFIEDDKGQVIRGNSDSVKIVGFHFGRKPTVALHVYETISKVRRRYWILRHLKRHGLTENELVKVYTSHIRSCIEFAQVIYGPMATAEQKADIEKLQSQSLRIIYCFNHSYRECLEKAGIQTLEERRKEAIRRFAAKTAIGQYSHWFPRNEIIGRTRNPLRYKECYARCDRLKNSPIYHMRRVLNEEENRNV
jgi:hypothetical protein